MNRDKALSILGLDTKATPTDIKSAYRRLARANHPDKMGSAELFKLVQEAYETLETTIKADANRKAETDRAEVKRAENRRKAAQRIAELQQKIAKVNETKRKAEERSAEALRLSRLLGTESAVELSINTDEALIAAVELEAILRVERVRLEAEHREGRRKTEAECPELARDVINAEWLSMREETRKRLKGQQQYRLVTMAIKGKPKNDDDRYFVTSGKYGYNNYGIWDNLIEEYGELTDQDFRVGGFYSWGGFLNSEGCPRLAIKHYNSAQWLRPSLWKIYSALGDTKLGLGRNAVRKCLCQVISGTCCDNAKQALQHYSAAMTDYTAGLRFTSHNREAAQALHQAIELVRLCMSLAQGANPSRSS